MVSRWNLKLGKSLTNIPENIELSYIYGLDPNCQMRTADTCYNSNSILQEIDLIVSKAEKLISQKAYLHLYERYCPDANQLIKDAIESMNIVRDSYSSLDQF
jgi:hypothetical protein